MSRCEAAVTEIKASRKLIDSYKDEIAKKEKALQNAVEKGTLDDEQIALNRQEIDKLRSALDHENNAYELEKSALVETKKALAKVTKEKNFYKTLTKLLSATTLAAGAAAAVLLAK